MNRRDFIKSAGLLPLMPTQDISQDKSEPLPTITIVPNIGNTDRPLIVITGISEEGYDNLLGTICKAIDTMQRSRHNVHASVIGLLNTRRIKSNLIVNTPREE